MCKVLGRKPSRASGLMLRCSIQLSATVCRKTLNSDRSRCVVPTGKDTYE